MRMNIHEVETIFRLDTIGTDQAGCFGAGLRHPSLTWVLRTSSHAK